MPTRQELALAEIEKQNNRLLREYSTTSNQLIRYYGTYYNSLEDEIELLGRDIASGGYTRATIQKTDTYNKLIKTASAGLLGYQAFLYTLSSGLQSSSHQYAGQDLANYVSVYATGGYKASGIVNTIDTTAMDVLTNYLKPGSELYNRIYSIAPLTADAIRQAILDGVAAGDNPITIANRLRDVLGFPLTDGLRITRTAQMWSYREADRANAMNNPDLFESWTWFAKLDGVTCMSCVGQHGTVHPIEEPLEDHHNGRCTRVNNVRGLPPIVNETGQQWFEKQDATMQKQMLRGAYPTWQQSPFDLSVFSQPYQDGVYGQMLRQKTLGELLAALGL